MPDLVTVLESDDALFYLVRGETSAEVFLRALTEAEQSDMQVLTAREDVEVMSHRAVPCPRFACGGDHPAHYIPATPGTQGSFRAALVEVAYLPDELDDRDDVCLWGVGSDGAASWGIQAQRDEESARRIAVARVRLHGVNLGPHRVYYRAAGNLPWREVVTVTSDLL